MRKVWSWRRSFLRYVYRASLSMTGVSGLAKTSSSMGYVHYRFKYRASILILYYLARYIEQVWRSFQQMARTRGCPSWNVHGCYWYILAFFLFLFLMLWIGNYEHWVARRPEKLVLFGHTHAPMLVQYSRKSDPNKKVVYCNTGSFIDSGQMTFAGEAPYLPLPQKRTPN